jgi:hypothetical protein
MDAAWRLEAPVGAKGGPARWAELLRRERATRVNLPVKSKADADAAVARALALAEALGPRADVCVHYALSHAYGGSAKAALARLRTAAAALAAARGARLLLVSGGDARALDTLAALRALAAAPPPALPPLAVAFNPYFPEEADRAAERTKLRAKLAAGFPIAEIYLQFGTNLALLEEGLDFLAGAAPQARVLGSALVPDARMLASLRFRPWRGLHVGDEYLSGVPAAEASLGRVLAVYRERGVAPLFEGATGVGGAGAARWARLARAAGCEGVTTLSGAAAGPPEGYDS